MSESKGRRTEVATLGGGCFWCVEAAFEQLQGVERVVSGYMGGHVSDPTYRDVCSGTTGHAEVIAVHFDPSVITIEDLLRVFFTVHDPTTRDRQGGDVGPQYRSVIFYDSPEQKRAASAVIAEVEAAELWDDAVVTEVSPAGVFYPAEDYHQEYYRNNPGNPYCAGVISPKLAKFRKAYGPRLKPEFRAPS